MKNKVSRESVEAHSPKVLHIASGDIWGGAEVQVLHQVSALIQRSHQVEVLLFNKGETKRRYEQAGIPCSIVDESLAKTSFFKEFFTTIEVISPQLVVSHGYKESIMAAICCLRLNIPWVATFHGFTESSSGLAACKMFIYSNVQKLLAKCFARKFVCVSSNLADLLGFSNSPRLEIVHNVTEMEQLEESCGLDLQHPAVVMVGRLVKVKRLDRGMMAFESYFEKCRQSSLPLPHMYIVGDGPLRAELEGKAEELNSFNHIHFLGFQENATSFIRAADLLMISSDSEGIPTVLLEAFSSLTSVVSTDVGGIKEALEKIPDYPAKILPLSQESALGGSIFEILEHKVSDTNRKNLLNLIIENFSPEVAAIRHEQIYSSVLG